MSVTLLISTISAERAHALVAVAASLVRSTPGVSEEELACLERAVELSDQRRAMLRAALLAAHGAGALREMDVMLRAEQPA